MNIFYVHPEPVVAATMLHDKHVVKMVLETTQILCAVHHRYGAEAPYRATHMNHPSVLWAGDTVQQYGWTWKHGIALANEYRARYGRQHACAAILDGLQRPPTGLHTAGWVQPPQCMPDEFVTPGDAIAGYRKYYLARKVDQSKWTRRDVPDFITNGEITMATVAKKTTKTATPPAPPAPAAKKVAAKTAPAAPAKKTVAKEEPAEAPAAKMRGPRGVTEDAVITLNVEGNPKREGSKAFQAFSHYEDGMTVGAYCDAMEASGLGKEATPNLVYDAAHGFIAIEGYEGNGELKIKEPKPAKEPKAAKGKPAKTRTADEKQAEAEDDAEAEEETAD